MATTEAELKTLMVASLTGDAAAAPAALVSHRNRAKLSNCCGCRPILEQDGLFQLYGFELRR